MIPYMNFPRVEVLSPSSSGAGNQGTVWLLGHMESWARGVLDLALNFRALSSAPCRKLKYLQ